jgi:hypothetical protein
VPSVVHLSEHVLLPRYRRASFHSVTKTVDVFQINQNRDPVSLRQTLIKSVKTSRRINKCLPDRVGGPALVVSKRTREVIIPMITYCEEGTSL